MRYIDPSPKPDDWNCTFLHAGSKTLYDPDCPQALYVDVFVCLILVVWVVTTVIVSLNYSYHAFCIQETEGGTLLSHTDDKNSSTQWEKFARMTSGIFGAAVLGAAAYFIWPVTALATAASCVIIPIILCACNKPQSVKVATESNPTTPRIESTDVRKPTTHKKTSRQ